MSLLYEMKDKDGNEMKLINTLTPCWCSLAGSLGFNKKEVSKIAYQASHENKQPLKMVLMQWLQGEEGLKSATWGTLIKCLEESNMNHLANKIKELMQH